MFTHQRPSSDTPALFKESRQGKALERTVHQLPLDLLHSLKDNTFSGCKIRRSERLVTNLNVTGWPANHKGRKAGLRFTGLRQCSESKVRGHWEA